MAERVTRALRDELDADLRAVEGRLKGAEGWRLLTAEQKAFVVQARNRAGIARQRLAAAEVEEPPPLPEPTPVPPPTAVRPTVQGEAIVWEMAPGAIAYKVMDPNLLPNNHKQLPSSARTYVPVKKPGTRVKVGWTAVYAGDATDHWVVPELEVTFSGAPPPPPPPDPTPVPTPTPTPTTGFALGTVANSNQSDAIASSKRLRANVIRLEFGNGDPVASVRSKVDEARAAGLRVLVQSGDPWSNLDNVVAWGKDLREKIIGIELGNEDSFSYKGSQGRGDEYGRNYKKVHDGLAGACKLLAQGDDPTGSGWTGKVRASAGAVDGWVTHPYGPPPTHNLGSAGNPRYSDRSKHLLDSVMSQTSGDVWVSEWGISTDGGNRLDDNYEWPQAMSYQEAADGLAEYLRWLTATYPRVKGLFYFQALDQTGSGTGGREHYFGLEKQGGGSKGPLTARYQELASGPYRG